MIYVPNTHNGIFGLRHYPSLPMVTLKLFFYFIAILTRNMALHLAFSVLDMGLVSPYRQLYSASGTTKSSSLRSTVI
jgi:hypothetical protein